MRLYSKWSVLKSPYVECSLHTARSPPVHKQCVQPALQDRHLRPERIEPRSASSTLRLELIRLHASASAIGASNATSPPATCHLCGRKHALSVTTWYLRAPSVKVWPSLGPLSNYGPPRALSSPSNFTGRPGPYYPPLSMVRTTEPQTARTWKAVRSRRRSRRTATAGPLYTYVHWTNAQVYNQRAYAVPFRTNSQLSLGRSFRANTAFAPSARSHGR